MFKAAITATALTAFAATAAMASPAKPQPNADKCYGISLARFLYESEPRRVLAMVERDPKTGIDRLVSGMMEFFQGTATFTCGTQIAPYQRVQIVGTKGRIEIEIRRTKRRQGRELHLQRWRFFAPDRGDFELSPKRLAEPRLDREAAKSRRIGVDGRQAQTQCKRKRAPHWRARKFFGWHSAPCRINVVFRT